MQYITIEKEKDYDVFFTNYISRETNTIKDEYVNEKFIFIIRIKDNCNLDEQILFEYYLIVSRYGKKNQFKLEINLPVLQEDGRAEYHRISTYGFIQENINKIQGTIVYANGQTQRMQHSELKGVRRLVPVFNIESENFRILKKLLILICGKISNRERCLG